MILATRQKTPCANILWQQWRRDALRPPPRGAAATPKPSSAQWRLVALAATQFSIANIPQDVSCQGLPLVGKSAPRLRGLCRPSLGKPPPSPQPFFGPCPLEHQSHRFHGLRKNLQRNHFPPRDRDTAQPAGQGWGYPANAPEAIWHSAPAGPAQPSEFPSRRPIFA